MLEFQKKGHACDRCHTQKLSCKRLTIDEPCVRCSKAKAICNITPRPKRGNGVSLLRSNQQGISRPQPSNPQTERLTFDTQFPRHFQTRCRSSSAAEEGLDPRYILHVTEDCIFGIPSLSSQLPSLYGNANHPYDDNRMAVGLKNSELNDILSFYFDELASSLNLELSPARVSTSRTDDIQLDTPPSGLSSSQIADASLETSFLHGAHSPDGRTERVPEIETFADNASRSPAKYLPYNSPGSVSIQRTTSRDWINMVMEPHLNLYHHQNDIKNDFHPAGENLDWTSGATGTAQQQIFAVDQTVILSQQLLDAYKSAC